MRTRCSANALALANGVARLCARLAARVGAQQSMAPTGSAFRKLSQRSVMNCSGSMNLGIKNALVVYFHGEFFRAAPAACSFIPLRPKARNSVAHTEAPAHMLRRGASADAGRFTEILGSLNYFPGSVKNSPVWFQREFDGKSLIRRGRFRKNRRRRTPHRMFSRLLSRFAGIRLTQGSWN